MRGPATKVFNGKRYERVGSEPSKNPNVRARGHTSSLKDWAQFQRDVNNSNVRIVKIAPGVYEAYSRRKGR